MRTDRTFVCTACRIRTWPVRRCPACGQTRWLGDLERAPLAHHETRLVEGGSGARGYLLAGGGAFGAVLSAVAFGTGKVGIAEVGLMASLVSVVVGVLAIPPRRAAPDVAWRLLESPVVRSQTLRTARQGRVRARETLIAPLTKRPCVAWRLVGRSGSMPIDDGRAVPFTLVTDRGEDGIEVDATIATLDLVRLGDERAIDPGDAELERWLAARGAPIHPTPVLREAILADGDEVEVIGTARERARADHGRSQATGPVLADLPGSPLIVRSPLLGPATIA